MRGREWQKGRLFTSHGECRGCAPVLRNPAAGLAMHVTAMASCAQMRQLAPVFLLRCSDAVHTCIGAGRMLLTESAI